MPATDALLAQYLRGQLLVMVVLAAYYSLALAGAGFDVAVHGFGRTGGHAVGRFHVFPIRFGAWGRTVVPVTIEDQIGFKKYHTAVGRVLFGEFVGEVAGVVVIDQGHRADRGGRLRLNAAHAEPMVFVIDDDEAERMHARLQRLIEAAIRTQRDLLARRTS